MYIGVRVRTPDPIFRTVPSLNFNYIVWTPLAPESL